MKIICTTRNYVDTKSSCEKEYCCHRMKVAMNDYKTKEHNTYGIDSNFRITEDDKVKLTTHCGYEDSHSMIIDHCPFCGQKIVIEHEEIDETKHLPVREVIVEKEVTKKKKHWWQK